MGKTGYNKCKDIIRELKRSGVEAEVDINTLKRTIKENIGTNEVTVKCYLRLLLELDFLKTNNFVIFVLNKDLCDKIGF